MTAAVGHSVVERRQDYRLHSGLGCGFSKPQIARNQKPFSSSSGDTNAASEASPHTLTMMDDEEVKLSHVLKKAVEQVSRDFQHLQDETLPKSQGAGERV